MRAIEIMMEEHRYIERMLKVIRKICYKILQCEEINYDDFDKVIEFIKNYADGHHHNKEEIFLFNKMVEKLGSTGEVIIKNGMLVEHDLGRGYVKELIEGLEKVKAGDEEAKLDIIAAAISYTHLLEKHIDKEDNVIYKFAIRELDDSILKEIELQCIEYETTNGDIRKKNIEILENLEAKLL
ncbi:hemerythrin HHE cation binding domain protein [Clostridium bornimense]|uniref:Hemerythrin HHE cation binding domain protein n=1 Tax=Clostridium bornimense TaxID=1216932 RepID=W6SGX3_9CLOT|nr:hemerythrin domain-containing protein [Clostridium bornimense]CDM68905.1 hemerythrin HHE cation binding domain protein [Clostridium bornimense]